MFTLTTLASTSTDSAAAAAGAGVGAFIGSVIGYVIAALSLQGMFTKAGEPAWAAWVPIYNTVVLLKISGKPWWWLLLLIIPVVNIVVLVLVSIALAKSFGQGTGFAVGLFLLPIIFYFVLSYGGSQYAGPGGTAVRPGGAASYV